MAGRRNAVEVRVLIQQADERVLNIRDELSLASRSASAALEVRSLRDCGGYSRYSGLRSRLLAVVPESAQTVVGLMSLPSSMRWPGTS